MAKALLGHIGGSDPRILAEIALLRRRVSDLEAEVLQGSTTFGVAPEQRNAVQRSRAATVAAQNDGEATTSDFVVGRKR